MACIGSDDTVYSAKKMPEVALRQIWHAASVDTSMRVKMVDIFSNFAETNDDLAKAVEEIIGGESPWGTGPERLVARTKVISAWRKSRNHLQHTDNLRTRLTENTQAIPEIPEAQYNEYRAAFRVRHPDPIVADYREPHKKFIERVL